MSEITIYHNPRCSKSRQTLELLKENGVTPKVVLYLDDTPTVKELKSIAKKLGVSAVEMMRTKEEIYRTEGLGGETDEAKLFEAMVKHPKLIERPIVVVGKDARIGRPPECVLEILT